MSAAERRRLRKGRLIAAGGVVGLLVAALLFLRCGQDFGLGGGDGEAPETPVVADAAPPPADAAPARCLLRLDADGLTLEGAAVTVEGAVEACRAAGAAELVVTGDASFGLRERLRQALREAAIDLYER
jgi:hypothetical protein